MRMSTEVKFSRPVEALGRNGLMKSVGLAIGRIGDDCTVEPLRTNGAVGRALLIVPRSAVAQVADVLQQPLPASKHIHETVHYGAPTTYVGRNGTVTSLAVGVYVNGDIAELVPTNKRTGRNGRMVMEIPIENRAEVAAALLAAAA